MKVMNLRFFIFKMFTFIVNLLCWYYAILFCIIYKASEKNWFYGGIISLIMEWFILGMIVPFAKALLRMIIRRFKKFRFLILIEYLYFILNFIG
jgi:hypothetical protein